MHFSYDGSSAGLNRLLLRTQPASNFVGIVHEVLGSGLDGLATRLEGEASSAIPKLSQGHVMSIRERSPQGGLEVEVRGARSPEVLPLVFAKRRRPSLEITSPDERDYVARTRIPPQDISPALFSFLSPQQFKVWHGSRRVVDCVYAPNNHLEPTMIIDGSVVPEGLLDGLMKHMRPEMRYDLHILATMPSDPIDFAGEFSLGVQERALGTDGGLYTLAWEVDRSRHRSSDFNTALKRGSDGGRDALPRQIMREYARVAGYDLLLAKEAMHFFPQFYMHHRHVALPGPDLVLGTSRSIVAGIASAKAELVYRDEDWVLDDDEADEFKSYDAYLNGSPLTYTEELLWETDLDEWLDCERIDGIVDHAYDMVRDTVPQLLQAKREEYLEFADQLRCGGFDFIPN